MMSPSIAAVPTPPPGLADWLAVFGWVLGIVIGCVTLWRMLNGGPARDVVTKSDHEKELGEIRKELTRHGDRRQKIYDEQTIQGGDIKALKEAVSGTKENIRRVEGKIDENTKLTSKIDGKVELINTAVGNLSSSVTNFMRDQAKRE